MVGELKALAAKNFKARLDMKGGCEEQVKELWANVVPGIVEQVFAGDGEEELHEAVLEEVVEGLKRGMGWKPLHDVAGENGWFATRVMERYLGYAQEKIRLDNGAKRKVATVPPAQPTGGLFGAAPACSNYSFSSTSVPTTRSNPPQVVGGLWGTRTTSIINSTSVPTTRSGPPQPAGFGLFGA